MLNQFLTFLSFAGLGEGEMFEEDAVSSEPNHPLLCEFLQLPSGRTECWLSCFYVPHKLPLMG